MNNIQIKPDLLLPLEKNVIYIDDGFELSTFDPNIATITIENAQNINLPVEKLSSRFLSLIAMENSVFPEEHYISIFQKEDLHKNLFYVHWKTTTPKKYQTKSNTEHLLATLFGDTQIIEKIEIFGTLSDAIYYVKTELKTHGYHYIPESHEWTKYPSK